MRKFVARLSSPSLVVATIALVVGLAGTGYAASQTEHSARSATAGGFPRTLASGKSEVGVWGVDGYSGGARRLVGASPVSFAFPLASAPKAHYVTSAPTAACPGRPARPSARPGNLCVYVTGSKNVGSATIYREIDNRKGAAPIGFNVVLTSRAKGSVYAFGSWAVRAR